jgi:hypothetical protein
MFLRKTGIVRRATITNGSSSAQTWRERSYGRRVLILNGFVFEQCRKTRGGRVQRSSKGGDGFVCLILLRYDCHCGAALDGENVEDWKGGAISLSTDGSVLAILVALEPVR